ncbi:unnamed protein product (mitochondrion) [Plasmodiophora brassicae]|uniref:Peptidase M24 domain-containing protein n=1 Tax=Plasmodiophora brassicae TaxID=37360 RepID=A0A0G4IZN3_PLABS|nr:hypothetical protein PBRA_001741 [Plasmodiophora brassicae]SPQ93829.1 unnamed protein product [Plasmodiophora brassicae]
MPGSRDSSVSSSAASSEETAPREVDETLNNQDVVTKYRACGDIANRVLGKLVSLVKPGTKIVQLCQVGDALIAKELQPIYNKKPKVDKGVAFPTCVSVNNVVGHFSPLTGDATEIAAGDVVKIDLGVQIDGYCAVVAHTVVCNPEGGVITGPVADVIVAAYTAAELVARMLVPGNKNSQCTEIIEKVAKDFHVNPIQAVTSHNLSRNVIAGKKEILSRSNTGHKVEPMTVEPLDVWAIDIQMSTGDGKPKELDKATTVFRRMPDVSYRLKMQASRFVASEIKSKFGAFPFTLRSIEDKRAKLGIAECKTHGLVEAFPVLEEKADAKVAHFKFTAMIMPSGVIKVTGLPIDLAAVKSEHALSDESLKTLLEQPLRKKKAKKSSTPSAAGAAPMEADA